MCVFMYCGGINVLKCDARFIFGSCSISLTLGLALGELDSRSKTVRGSPRRKGRLTGVVGRMPLFL